MNNLNQITAKFFAVALICCAINGQAQNKVQKLKKSFKADSDVSITVDTRHTNIIFETWNKNQVEVEAYLESADSKTQSEMLNKWNLDVTGSNDQVNISSTGVKGSTQIPDMPPMPEMDGLGEALSGLMENLVGPMLGAIAENPLPPEFAENLGSLHFDFEAYERDGEAYMKKWEQQVEKKFGKDFEVKMEAWGKNFEAETEKSMAKWEKKYEKDMEVWGEKFGREMEAWGEEFGKKMEAAMSGENNNFGTGGKIDGKRTIIVRMPKNAVLKVNVRHGEIKLAELTTNLKADLTHSRLAGGTIDGAKTSINSSYGSVFVDRWNYGVLNASYVQECIIENAKSIKLTSNSSDVTIKNLTETGILSGTFAKLAINNLAADFKNLNINLENSNLVLKLPDAALNFNYNGSQSKIKYPAGIKGKPLTSYDNELINGYYKSNNTDHSISIKAKFSEVVVK